MKPTKKIIKNIYHEKNSINLNSRKYALAAAILAKICNKKWSATIFEKKKKITETKLMSHKFTKEYKSHRKKKIDYVKDKL